MPALEFNHADIPPSDIPRLVLVHACVHTHTSLSCFRRLLKLQPNSASGKKAKNLSLSIENAKKRSDRFWGNHQTAQIWLITSVDGIIQFGFNLQDFIGGIWKKNMIGCSNQHVLGSWEPEPMMVCAFIFLLSFYGWGPAFNVGCFSGDVYLLLPPSCRPPGWFGRINYAALCGEFHLVFTLAKGDCLAS